MSGFYYFLPGVTKDQLVTGDRFNRGPLVAAGIDEVLGDVYKWPHHASVAETHRASGPWNTTGSMLAIVNRHTGVPDLVVPDFARQVWEPRGDGSKCWIGAINGEPPLPEELERWEQIPGYLLADSGNYQWRMPVARTATLPFGHLPQSYVFSDAGEPEGRVQPAYQWLVDLSGQLLEHYATGEKQPFSWLVKQAARLLGVNYRVGLPELNFLHQLGREVLTQITVNGACHCAFGFDLPPEAAAADTGTGNESQ